MNSKEIGNRVRELMAANGDQPIDFHRKTGVAVSSISRLLNGNFSRYPREQLEKVARFYDVDLSYFESGGISGASTQDHYCAFAGRSIARSASNSQSRADYFVVTAARDLDDESLVGLSKLRLSHGAFTAVKEISEADALGALNEETVTAIRHIVALAVQARTERDERS